MIFVTNFQPRLAVQLGIVASGDPPIRYLELL